MSDQRKELVQQSIGAGYDSALRDVAKFLKERQKVAQGTVRNLPAGQKSTAIGMAMAIAEALDHIEYLYGEPLPSEEQEQR